MDLLDNWKETKKYLMKDQCAICYGLTLMIEVATIKVQEGRGLPLEMILVNSLITLIT